MQLERRTKPLHRLGSPLCLHRVARVQAASWLMAMEIAESARRVRPDAGSWRRPCQPADWRLERLLAFGPWFLWHVAWREKRTELQRRRRAIAVAPALDRAAPVPATRAVCACEEQLQQLHPQQAHSFNQM